LLGAVNCKYGETLSNHRLAVVKARGKRQVLPNVLDGEETGFWSMIWTPMEQGCSGELKGQRFLPEESKNGI
jgi:hypothetical protein